MSTKSVRFVAALIIVASIVGNRQVAWAGRNAMSGADAPSFVPPASSLGVQFVHFATAANTSSQYTIIDHPLANGHPDAILLVTPNWNPGEDFDGVYDDHPIGVWYTSGRWRIFNQDIAAMPVGAAFNVIIPTAGANVFVHKATTPNIGGNTTLIDNALTNGNPDAIIFVTPSYDPGGACPCEYVNFPIGVYYSVGSSKWKIFNQNGVLSSMPVNTSFNVFVLSEGQGIFVHKATTVSGDTTFINNALTNDNPNEIVFVTPNWNPGGAGGTYDNHNIGVYFNPEIGLSGIFNQDIATMPIDAAFNVLVLVPSSDIFVHTATADNATILDNALTNSHPNAIAFVTPNFNPGGGGGMYYNHNFGVWYDGLWWEIFGQDLAAMPVGAAFNVLLPDPDADVFVHKASAANTTLHTTTIDYPLTNVHPNAIIILTPNYNPGEVGGTYNDHPTGVYYYGGRWVIFNQDISVMPVGAAFNVFVPTAGPNAFVHTATAGNISGAATFIDSSLLSNNPYANVLITSNYNPGGVGGTYEDHPTGVYYEAGRWTIFNQDLAPMEAGAAFNVYVYANRIYLPVVRR